MTYRHSRQKLAFQERRFAAVERASQGHQDNALRERVSRDEAREIVHQQRLHFLLLERAMEHLCSEATGEAAAGPLTLPTQPLPSPDARAALQHDLEAILLAELCDESELDSSIEIASPDFTRGTGGLAS